MSRIILMLCLVSMGLGAQEEAPRRHQPTAEQLQRAEEARVRAAEILLRRIERIEREHPEAEPLPD